jgi:hypothetical protein
VTAARARGMRAFVSYTTITCNGRWILQNEPNCCGAPHGFRRIARLSECALQLGHRGLGCCILIEASETGVLAHRWC